jgi:hypothetical protein
MSKPNHRMRGKGYYIGYGYTSTDLNAKKGAAPYHEYLLSEIGSLPDRRCPDHYDKLCRYLERTK